MINVHTKFEVSMFSRISKATQNIKLG